MGNDSETMQFKNFGEIRIFRPSYASELEIRFASENHLANQELQNWRKIYFLSGDSLQSFGQF